MSGELKHCEVCDTPMMGKCELCGLRAERDRYREALEWIAVDWAPMTLQHCKTKAREALTQPDSKENSK